MDGLQPPGSKSLKTPPDGDQSPNDVKASATTEQETERDTGTDPSTEMGKLEIDGGANTSGDSQPGDGDESQPKPVVLHELYLRKVILYPNGVVCKSSQGLPIAEAKALEVASEAGLPAPRSFGGFKAPFETICNGNEIPDSGTVYAEGFSPVIHVHMSHVPGQPLDKLWKDMAEDQRRNIARQLGEIVKKMRAVPPPPNYIGTCDGKQIRDPRLYDTYTGPTCDSEQAFNEWLISEIRSVVAPLVKEAFARRLRTGHRIVLSHCDLTPRNIMVDEEGKNITGLIDWENSGWYPEYWEYVKFFHSYSTDGWRNYAEYIFPEIYHDELIEYTALLRYQK